MKLRVLLASAFLLAVGAIGAWTWFGIAPPPPYVPEAPAVASTAGIAATSPAETRDVPSSAQATGVASPPSPKVAPRVQQVRVTSSVAPGMPLARTASLRPGPLAAAAPAVAGGPVSRATPQAGGKADLENVQLMLRDFRTRMGENPVGSNAEIMQAVMGANPAKARLGPPQGQGLNEQGELIDRWATPYFFHQISKDSMEVRSAGPDRVMWTGDDVVTK